MSKHDCNIFCMHLLDRYIIKKFLGTFFYSIGLIITIAIVFDFSEKVDDFINKHAPAKAIIFDYYLNFIPYFANLFSPLFVFISVIFFTARMAGNTEIVAILSSGISFRRMLVPYFISAFILAALSFYLNGWVIPHSNKTRLAFENVYIKNPYVYKGRNIHRQISPGVYVYFESFNNSDNIGYRFSMEKIKNGAIDYKLMADYISWNDTSKKWSVYNYFIRENINGNDRIRQGERLDTAYTFDPSEFSRRITYIEAMDNAELDEFIEEERMKGAENIQFYHVEKYKRSALPFSTFILTLMGVSIASRKTRGGIGVSLGMGILLSFTYILFMQVSYTFATNGNLPALLAVWIPNIIYAVFGIFLLQRAPK